MNTLTYLALGIAYTLLVGLWWHEFIRRIQAEVALMDERTMRKGDLRRFKDRLREKGVDKTRADSATPPRQKGT
jgi:hypothetical protein